MIKQAILSCITATAVTFGLAGCMLNVKSDVNKPLFSQVQCRTFSWAGSFRSDTSPQRATIANPVNEARLRAAIASHLQGMGMQLVNSDAELTGWLFRIRLVDPGELDGLMDQSSYQDYTASL